MANFKTQLFFIFLIVGLGFFCLGYFVGVAHVISNGVVERFQDVEITACLKNDSMTLSQELSQWANENCGATPVRILFYDTQVIEKESGQLDIFRAWNCRSGNGSYVIMD